MKAVHLNIGAGQPLCGYNRWRGGSMELSSTKNLQSVTCKRCHKVAEARMK